MCVCVCVGTCMITYLITAGSIRVCLHLRAGCLSKESCYCNLLQELVTLQLSDKLLWYHHHHHHLSIICLTTGQQPLTKLVICRVPSSALSLNLRCSLRSASSCSHLLIVLPSLLSFFQLHSWEGQFLCKMWPIPLAFFLFIVRRLFLSSFTLRNISSFFTRSVQLIFSIFLQHRISELSREFWSTFRSVQLSAPEETTLQVQQNKMSDIHNDYNRIFFVYTYSSCQVV